MRFASGNVTMKVSVFSTKPYDRHFLEAANADASHELIFFEPRLTCDTAVLAASNSAICPFVNDKLDRETLTLLAQQGTRLIALRCAGFNNVDLAAAAELEMTVARVPAYSPHAVAEHTIALILSLNRKIHRAYSRVREGNFALNGLLGFDLNGCTVGIIGTGRIGKIVGKIVQQGFDCNVLAYDLYPDPKFEAQGVKYVDLPKLFAMSDIISLHCPLTPDNYHLIDAAAIDMMKPGVMLVNTSRGALIDTQAIIDGLKSRKIGYLALDVYEQEADLFFEDLSDSVIQDDVFERLLTFPNVIITGHQAFFTQNALQSIAETTLNNVSDFEQGRSCNNTINLEDYFAPKGAG